jgi:NodT family efflux transporter outer membrane factor (OMF) lipoprotein
MRHATFLSAVAACSLLLGGCLAVNRDARPPTPQLPAHWTAPAAATSGAMSTPDWWRNFGDPALDALVHRALARNADLALAAIRVRNAQLQAGLADTNLTPDVSASVSAGRSLDLEHGGHSPTSYSAGASLGYIVDLWGNLARQRDQAHWELAATRADLDAARLTLVGTTARLYWGLGFLNQRIATDNQDLTTAEKVLQLTRSKYAAGAVSGLDLAQAEQALASQRAAHTDLLQSRTEQRHALAILLDLPPEQRVPEPRRLPDGPVPGIEAGVPADVLARRPDLHAAELRLRAALAQMDVTRTSFYPALSLTGSYGSSSLELANVLAHPMATLGAALSLPFVQWHTMKLKLAVSRNQYQSDVIGFRHTLYDALGEVEDALSRRQQLLAEATLRAQALKLERRAEAMAHTRYLSGATGVQLWLDEQQRLRQAQLTMDQNRLDQLDNMATLYQALGGAP